MQVLNVATMKVNDHPSSFNQITQRFILKRFRGGETAEDLAKEFGVSIYTINNVLRQARHDEKNIIEEIKAEDEGKRKRLMTAEDRKQICQASDEGLKPAEIAKKLGWSYTACCRVIKSYRDNGVVPLEGTIPTTPKKGFRKVTPEQEKDITKRYLDGEDVKALAKEYEISEYTAYKVLLENGVGEKERSERRTRIRLAADIVEKFLNHYSISRIADDLEVSEELVKEVLAKEDQKQKAANASEAPAKEVEIPAKEVEVPAKDGEAPSQEIETPVEVVEPVDEELPMELKETDEQKEIRELKCIIESLQMCVQVKQAKINELMVTLNEKNQTLEKITQLEQVRQEQAELEEQNQAMRALLKMVL